LEPGRVPLFLSLAIAVSVAAVPRPAAALEIEIMPMVGHQWGADILVTGGALELDNSANYGLILDFGFNKGYQLEVSYTRQDTRMSFIDSTGADTELFDVAVEYIQVGALLGVKKGRTLTFSSFSMGFTHLNPKGVDATSDWRFSLAIGVGTKIYFTDHVGIRLQGRLMPTFIPVGKDLFCGDDGCYTTLESGAMLQGEIAAGLVIAF
jgi:opacity protein-like surface antigen